MLSLSRVIIFTILLISAFSSYKAFAGELHGHVTFGKLELTNIWLKTPPAGAKVLSGYLTIKNIGETSDRLVSVGSDIAMRNEVHEMKMDGDVMSMRPLDDGVEIGAGSIVTLKPGGIHLMIMGVDKTIETGDKIKITLMFENAGQIDVEFPVLEQADGMKMETE